MALLFEKSAGWRRLVAATRDPRVMAAFTVASVATAGGVAFATQSVTDATGTAAAEKAAEATVARDWEAARYAAHSKRALGVLFDDVRGGGADKGGAAGGVSTDSGGGGSRSQKPIDYRAIKLPGVAWHPAVAAKERAAKEAAAAKERAAAAAAVATAAAAPAAAPAATPAAVASVAAAPAPAVGAPAAAAPAGAIPVAAVPTLGGTPAVAGAREVPVVVSMPVERVGATAAAK